MATEPGLTVALFFCEKISLTKRAGHRNRRFLPLDFQNGLRHPHRNQHMEYCYGRVRRGAECGQQCGRNYRFRHIHRHQLRHGKPTDAAHGYGPRPPVRAVVPEYFRGLYHVGAHDLHFHHRVREDDRDLFSHLNRADPDGDDAQPRMGRHGPELSALPVRTRFSGLSHYRLCSNLRRFGTGNRCGYGCQQGNLDMHGLYGAAVLYAL